MAVIRVAQHHFPALVLFARSHARRASVSPMIGNGAAPSSTPSSMVNWSVSTVSPSSADRAAAKYPVSSRATNL